MIIFDEDRPSDSPFVERVWRCHSEGAAPFLSIAASRCELVVSRLGGKVTVTVRGPETRANPLGDCPGNGEWLGILFKVGTHLVHLPTGKLVDAEVNLPTVLSTSFWLFDSAWQLPDYENADTFVDWLVRKGELARDPIVNAALQGHLKDRDPRTLQRPFLRVTGLIQSAVRQIERARYATYLLRASRLDPGYCSRGGLFRSVAPDPIAQVPYRTNACPDPREKPTRADAVFVQDNAPLDES